MHHHRLGSTPCPNAFASANTPAVAAVLLTGAARAYAALLLVGRVPPCRAPARQRQGDQGGGIGRGKQKLGQVRAPHMCCGHPCVAESQQWCLVSPYHRQNALPAITYPTATQSRSTTHPLPGR